MKNVVFCELWKTIFLHLLPFNPQDKKLVLNPGNSGLKFRVWLGDQYLCWAGLGAFLK
jgi:hypothetical protein